MADIQTPYGIVRNPSARRFYIPCELCGREIRRTQYSKKRRYVCDYCKRVIKEKQKIEIPLVETIYDKRFREAIEEISKQIDIVEYQKSINTADKAKYLFGSIPEAMAAIELLHLGYKVIPQQKIGKYKVDFVLPDEKVVIEIDGKLYHETSKEGKRDMFINLSLGCSWKIIHISAEKIRTNIKKMDEIIHKFKELE